MAICGTKGDVSGSVSSRKARQLQAEAVGAVSEWFCLRCDWTGEADGTACPRCGVPLYRYPEPATPRAEPPARRRATVALLPRPRPARHQTRSSPVESTQDDESIPPAAPVVAAAGRRSAVVVVALTAAAVWIVATGGPFGRTQTPPAPTRPPDPSPTRDLFRPARAVLPASFVIDLSTGETTPLPQSLLGGWSYPVSPDGTMFAYSEGACPPCTPPIETYVADVDGTGVRQVATPGVLDAFGPSWSPDGSVLVYQGSGGLDEVGDLFVVDLATEEVRRITDLAPRRLSRFSLSPSFSPDGETILFQLPRGSQANPSDVGTPWDLWSVPVAGGEPTLVRRDAAMGVYSPDGSTLAYLDALRASVGGGFRSRLWLADADGSDPRLFLIGEFAFLRWSPDGTKIAYGGDGMIRVVDVATGQPSYVADGVTAEWLDPDTLVVGGPGSVI